MLELLDDMQELQPTIFMSVPRLYSRIFDRVMAAIREGNALSRKLFEAGFAAKKAALERGDLTGGRFAPFWDRLVFSKIAARLGGGPRMPRSWRGARLCHAAAQHAPSCPCAWELLTSGHAVP